MSKFPRWYRTPQVTIPQSIRLANLTRCQAWENPHTPNHLATIMNITRTICCFIPDKIRRKWYLTVRLELLPPLILLAVAFLIRLWLSKFIHILALFCKWQLGKNSNSIRTNGSQAPDRWGSRASIQVWLLPPWRMFRIHSSPGLDLVFLVHG